MRIITGTAKGARLKSPRGMTTRPTSDRVKESLFSILGRRVFDARVLDIFAGTGGLGLESLSRGSRIATFIDRATAGIIRDNAEHTRLIGRAVIIRGDVFSVMERMAIEGEQFDLVFCDPPYKKGLWEKALAYLDGEGGALLADDALIIVEHGADENEMPELATLARQRNVKYGHTTQISIFAGGRK
ncbi:MAG: 16S rRNA (guanine(966)-N(2))-methyltransferase RsmD [Schwartzia sp.]|nr:16S rRNA (guanine(966)-N(2))-methyltransferase RsmD [Schwartzia sp. (in: firmicutes)]